MAGHRRAAELSSDAAARQLVDVIAGVVGVPVKAAFATRATAPKSWAVPRPRSASWPSTWGP